LRGRMVNWSFFQLLGVQPQVGRRMARRALCCSVTGCGRKNSVARRASLVKSCCWMTILTK
jgi:hypothetical protein